MTDENGFYIPDHTESTRIFRGYTWYWSALYGNFQLISPKSGFYHFPDEQKLLRFIHQESGHDAATEYTLAGTASRRFGDLKKRA